MLLGHILNIQDWKWMKGSWPKWHCTQLYLGGFQHVQLQILWQYWQKSNPRKALFFCANSCASSCANSRKCTCGLSWCSCNLGLSLGGGASCRSTSISIFQFQTKLITSFVAFVLLNPFQKSMCGSKKASLMIYSSPRPLLPISLSTVWFTVITQQQSLCVPLPIKGDISESVLQHVKNLRWQIAGLRAHTHTGSVVSDVYPAARICMVHCGRKAEEKTICDRW